MPKNTTKPLQTTGCLSLHYHHKLPAQSHAFPGSQSRFLTPASLLIALLYLGAQQAQAATFTVESNQTAEDVVIDNGDIQVVKGKATNITVRGKSAGGQRSSQYVFGLTEKTTVEASGAQYVESGGTAKNTTVKSSGSLNVDDKATIEDLTVESGGTAYLVAGSIWKG
ncbi:hypothetical protein [Methylophilus luteus]|uniref:Autotransporter outer membrane beta-barrel domain-containing protein n=1 Tax=Methylophilus luteus TaxID=640108 RepID=A0ABW3FE67_9PROT